ncbi:hypothetical protein B296_00013052 [Ensete ventricosum]|uniref:Uncharacterized protein n=1 Tax=Ensete ventricosum TaxID=4639 RepID=A0A427AZA8_ENSVE|nr:hypothetical protein B296_00013052 [Ensete ventricosum]
MIALHLDDIDLLYTTSRRAPQSRCSEHESRILTKTLSLNRADSFLPDCTTPSTNEKPHETQTSPVEATYIAPSHIKPRRKLERKHKNEEERMQHIIITSFNINTSINQSVRRRTYPPPVEPLDGGVLGWDIERVVLAGDLAVISEGRRRRVGEAALLIALPRVALRRPRVHLPATAAHVTRDVTRDLGRPRSIRRPKANNKVR